MKLAVFSYPRTASTLLLMTMGRSLILNNRFKIWQIINEPFNPQKNQLLVDTGNHALRVDLTDTPLTRPQNRHERVSIMTRYSHQDYLIKILVQDIDHPGVYYFLKKFGYKFVTVERRDPYQALLSVLVAFEHDYWNNIPRDKRPPPEYHAIHGDLDVATFMCNRIVAYEQYKRIISEHIIASVYFEDIITMTQDQILEEIGLEPIGAIEPPTKKLLGARNEDFITNIDEVREVYDRIVGDHHAKSY